MATTAVTVTNTAKLIVAANTARRSLIITNNSSTVVFLSEGSNVTIANGIQLNQNDVLSDSDSGTNGYQGAIYGIANGTTADIRYWERTYLV